MGCMTTMHFVCLLIICSAIQKSPFISDKGKGLSKVRRQTTETKNDEKKNTRSIEHSCPEGVDGDRRVDRLDNNEDTDKCGC